MKADRRADDRCFGMHHDLHADPTDTEIGARCEPKRLAPMLALGGVQYVQTDSKGHPGYATWRSRTPAATVAPGLVADALQGWREATRRLGLPLHSHYSGLWDKAAGAKHPDWCIVNAAGQRIHQPFFFCSSLPDAPDAGDRMCPRGPYVDELMIPQLFEMMDRYGVDGFWIDGDLWAMEPCYCPRCRRAFTEATGHAAPPTDPADPLWTAWWEFTRAGFEAYVKRYCDAVHGHKPGVRIASNWLHCMKHPGEPHLPVDWLSFDYPIVWGGDNNRCEARFLSTRGKPWDVLLWDFYSTHGMWERHSPWTTPPLAMVQQQAAVLLAFGGRVLACEAPMAPFALRSGQLIPWRMQQVRNLGRFVKRRWPLCRDTATIPQVAVLHSEHHARASVRGRSNLMAETDVAPAYGATFSLLECHYGVDVMDEWALLPRLREFPVVVAPEQDRMSDAMVAALKAYVEQGGKLLLSGARALERFGSAFLGVDPGTVEADKTYHVPAGSGATPIYSKEWRLVKPLAGARGVGTLGATPLLDEFLLPHPAGVLRRAGKGAVLYLPFDVFRDFNTNRYPLSRAFIGACLKALAGRLDVDVSAPVCVDVVLRQKRGRRIAHLVNRASGIPNQPNNGAIDEIPPVGPVTIRMRLPARPKRVTLAFEREPLQWTFDRGKTAGVLTVTVVRVALHSAVVIDGGERRST